MGPMGRPTHQDQIASPTALRCATVRPGERLIVALDRSEREEILRLADQLRGVVGMLKVGLQAFVSNGPSIVQELIADEHEVFLDLKFHDIPNTASNAVAEAARLGARLTNVHASGGAAMLRACAEAIPEGSRTQLLGVTILTSLSDEDVSTLGYSGGASENVARLARLCRDSGVPGVVASPNEIELIRGACGDDFLILTPGIRAAADASGDQKRTMTAREAVQRGATWIVVGRPITGERDPRAAAERIVDSMAR